MLALATRTGIRSVRCVTDDTTTTEQATDETKLLGQALARLRKRAGLTQMEAAQAYGVTQQTWQRFEAGLRPSIFRLGVLKRLTEVVEATPEDLNIMVARIAGRPIEANVFHPPGLREEPAEFATPMSTRVRMVDAGLAYDLTRPDGAMDLRWLLGPDVGAIRVAESQVKALKPGWVVVFDRSRFPARDDLCVVETANGSTFVFLYGGRDGAKIIFRHDDPEQRVELDAAKVQGIYAVRLAGPG